MFSCEFYKIFKNMYFKEHLTTASTWAVFSENILMLKICFRAITSAQNARTTTMEVLRRCKDYIKKKKKKRKEQRFVEISQYLKHYNVFTKCRTSHLKVFFKKRF